jgi:hypothetical protein
MRWKKLGIVWHPEGSQPWARTHGMVPTPVPLPGGKIIRVYLTCLDTEGRGRPGYVDLDASDPTRVLGALRGPLLELGQPGCFDDNGLVVTSVVPVSAEKFHMYYAGFELCQKIRYRIFTGLAISQDGGRSFRRHSEAPVLDRADGELFFRAGPFVMLDGSTFKLWYVSGSSWTRIQGKDLPVYDLRYMESQDGIHWESSGRMSLPVTQEDEHGFGRPWVLKRGQGDYRLFYSVRRRSFAAYRLGYAESSDGLIWARKDSEIGLDVSPEDFDSREISYAAVVDLPGRSYCFYNGNGFGSDGVGLAVLES